jgi:AAA15 family ATPase/GTPase
MRNLETVTIHQFRGLRDLELKDLGRINLLVGLNNSGKTSVLEALSVYCHPLDIKVWLSTANQREQDIGVYRIRLLDAIKWLFTHNSASIVEPDKPIILISSTGLFSVKKLIASYEEMEQISLSEESNIRNISNEEEIENEDTPRVRKGINLKIEVSLDDYQLSLLVQHKKLGLAPVSTFGDGIRRLLHIALKLASVKGGILLIDELESTIHTEALQSSFQWLVKWCTEMDVQLFATTHSLEAVDALLEVTESDSDLVLYRLEPKEGKTKVVRHDGHRLRRLREELGQEVRW